ncbi:MAG: agmatine deiminase family protein [Gammaproteobacteria bacterium]|nr:agmatine deiminase family protein [Gammaproteobacteria bacterium]
MRRYPAEWETQSGIQLTWPHDKSDWAPMLDEVEPVFIQIALHICVRQKLLLVCRDAAHQQYVQLLMANAGVDGQQVCYYLQDSNDTWARDHGPISIEEDGKPLLLDFIFNGWGNKFDATLDNALTPALYKLGAFNDTKVETHRFVLEGGGLETDGEGTLLTTRHCLLSPQRNPQYNEAEIALFLQNTLGIKRILWLTHGHLEGDDTDSHIDTLVRFGGPTKLIYVACDDQNDEHYADLKAMEDELTQFTTMAGELYELLPLPWPQPIYDNEGQRLPASYANFLVINGAVLVPTYRDEADQQALNVIRQGYPQHEVFGIDCLPLIHQYGSLHCVTMNYINGIL